MYRITQSVIDISRVQSEVQDDAAGALVTFTGTVRKHSRGKNVIRMLYESHVSMAENYLKKIGDAALEKFDITRVAVVHRTGMLDIGDIAVVIAVSAPHRKDAFDSCQYIIDRIKKEVPIWKKEFYDDGESWVSEGS